MHKNRKIKQSKKNSKSFCFNMYSYIEVLHNLSIYSGGIFNKYQKSIAL